jgi:hypothetical protein
VPFSGRANPACISNSEYILFSLKMPLNLHQSLSRDVFPIDTMSEKFGKDNSGYKNVVKSSG